MSRNPSGVQMPTPDAYVGKGLNNINELLGAISQLLPFGALVAQRGLFRCMLDSAHEGPLYSLNVTENESFRPGALTSWISR